MDKKQMIKEMDALIQHFKRRNIYPSEIKPILKFLANVPPDESHINDEVIDLIKYFDAKELEPEDAKPILEQALVLINKDIKKTKQEKEKKRKLRKKMGLISR